MKALLCFSAISAAIILSTSFNHHSSGTPAILSDSTQLPPVETRKANSDYKPAFTGQTRINGVRTTTAYKVEKIAERIGRPWAIVPLPDGRLLVTEKSGFMQIYAANGSLVKKITGFPEVDDGGQGGLLDVAPDPSFSQNKTIYWSFSEEYENGNLLSVAKGKLSADETTIQNPVVIFRATPALNSSLHFGSRILFDRAGNMFVSTGERSILEGRKQAQWLNSHLGKIFRITKDGKAAPGNPFLNDKNAMPEIYAMVYGMPRASPFIQLPAICGKRNSGRVAEMN